MSAPLAFTPGTSRPAQIAMLVAVAVTLTLLGGSAVRWHLPCVSSCGDSTQVGHGQMSVVGQDGPSLGIRGRAVRTLSPGLSAPVDLVLVNRQRFAVVAWRFTVRIGSVVAPGGGRSTGCTPGDFSVAQAPATMAVRVPARSTTTLSNLSTLSTASAAETRWPRVSMPDLPVSQDRCRGVVLDLRFRSSVRQAR